MMFSLAYFLKHNPCAGFNMQSSQLIYGSDAHGDYCQANPKRDDPDWLCHPEWVGAHPTYRNRSEVSRGHAKCFEYWRFAYPQLLELYSLVDYALLTDDDASYVFFFCTVLQLDVPFCDRQHLHGLHLENGRYRGRHPNYHPMPHANVNGNNHGWYHDTNLRTKKCPGLRSDAQWRTAMDRHLFLIFFKTTRAAIRAQEALQESVVT